MVSLIPTCLIYSLYWRCGISLILSISLLPVPIYMYDLRFSEYIPMLYVEITHTLVAYMYISMSRLDMSYSTFLEYKAHV